MFLLFHNRRVYDEENSITYYHDGSFKIFHRETFLHHSVVQKIFFWLQQRYANLGFGQGWKDILWHGHKNAFQGRKSPLPHLFYIMVWKTNVTKKKTKKKKNLLTFCPFISNNAIFEKKLWKVKNGRAMSIDWFNVSLCWTLLKVSCTYWNCKHYFL